MHMPIPPRATSSPARYGGRAHIGTAVALGALALNAGAQNITLYGTADVSVVAARNIGSAHGTQWLAGSGVVVPSRWGLQGREDLGGGITASFVLESGIDLDTGSLKPFAGNPSAATPTAPNGPGATGFNRRAHVGLSGSLGQILLGRDYSPLYYAGLATDVMHYGYFGNLQTLVQAAGGAERLARVSNGVFYTSPVLSGFRARAAYSFGSESAGGSAGALPRRANTFHGVGGEYTGGSLSLHATHQVLRYPEAGGTPAVFTGRLLSRRDSMLGAIHTSGPFQFGASYWKMTGAQKADSVSAGVSYAFQANRIYLQLQRLTHNSTPAIERSATTLGIALAHHLSRRTQLYASYGITRNSANAAFALVASDVAIAPTGPGQKPSALALGIRHDF